MKNNEKNKPEFIEVEDYSENKRQKSKVEGIYKILEKFFLDEMLNLCYDNFKRLFAYLSNFKKRLCGMDYYIFFIKMIWILRIYRIIRVTGINHAGDDKY